MYENEPSKIISQSLNTGFKRSILKTLTGVDEKHLPQVELHEINKKFLENVSFGYFSMINADCFAGE